MTGLGPEPEPGWQTGLQIAAGSALRPGRIQQRMLQWPALRDTTGRQRAVDWIAQILVANYHLPGCKPRSTAAHGSSA